MTVSRQRLALIAVAVVLLLAGVFVIGRGCAPAGGGTVVVVGGIDAGPGEEIIAGRLDGSVQAGQVRIEDIEHKFDSDLAAFDAQQREEYERLRGGDDLEAAAEMLSAWNHERRARKEDAGT